MPSGPLSFGAPPIRTERKQPRVTKRAKRGRPSEAQEKARSKRVVTFVTERELECLEQIADKEDRSLSAVVHRILAQHLKNIGPSENAE